MLDDSIDFLRGIRQRPVWSPIPEQVKAALSQPVPWEPQGLEAVWSDFKELVQPYSTGNTHPRFFGWVHGSGTPAGMLAEMLAASLNANLGGRDHAPIYVERAVIEWCRELFGFPGGSSGLVVSGTSMANLIALAVARNAARMEAGEGTRQLVAYASTEVHDSVWKVLRVLGLEDHGFRPVPTDREFRMDVLALERAMREDLAAGHRPFLVVGTAGTVNTGAVDDLGAISRVCRTHGVWFHVDGAFGALAALSPSLRDRVEGIREADSLAFDFHKWMHVPYDAGFVLIRDGEAHRRCFSTAPSYLERTSRGLSGGAPWFTEFGPELSRGFRALKVWVTMRHFGLRRIAEKIEENCAQAHHLAGMVSAHPSLQLAAPVTLNIVCFSFKCPGLTATQLEWLNREIVFFLHEQGLAAPSTVRLRGEFHIRVNLTNHRCTEADLEKLVEDVVRIGEALAPAAQGN
jgi:glutamate/tyrosine decarboxylase-like PLP-dependent enzyme